MKAILLVLSVPVASAILYVLYVALAVNASDHRELNNPVD